MNLSRRNFIKGLGLGASMLVFSPLDTLKIVEKMSPTDTGVYWEKIETTGWQQFTGNKESILAKLRSGGIIGEVKIYNRALSLQEIQEIYRLRKEAYGL